MFHVDFQQIYLCCDHFKHNTIDIKVILWIFSYDIILNNWNVKTSKKYLPFCSFKALNDHSTKSFWTLTETM